MTRLVLTRRGRAVRDLSLVCLVVAFVVITGWPVIAFVGGL